MLILSVCEKMRTLMRRETEVTVTCNHLGAAVVAAIAVCNNRTKLATGPLLL